MANEITVGLTMEYLDSLGVTASLPANVINTIVNSAAKKVTCIKQNIGTSEEALLLGDVSSVGFVIVVNLDPTNFVEVRVATGGAKFAKLFPQGSATGINWYAAHHASGAQAPYAIADTAACDVLSIICSL